MLLLLLFKVRLPVFSKLSLVGLVPFLYAINILIISNVPSCVDPIGRLPGGSTRVTAIWHVLGSLFKYSS